jgi:uncharacterized protein
MSEGVLSASGTGLVDPAGLTVNDARSKVDLAEPTSSVYVPARDGTRIAVDLWLPHGAQQPLPSIVVFTRYWRGNAAKGALIAPGLRPIVEHFVPAGYAALIVDVRGTGASFGARECEWAPSEVSDFGDVFDWVTKQFWSNGRIATIGTSYSGNTAELALLAQHPALSAIVPRFSDFTEYQHAFRPGGLRNTVIADDWVAFITALDRNDVHGAMLSRGEEANPDWKEGVRPVAGDTELLAQAVSEHANNVDLRTIMARLAYSDDPFGPDHRRDLTLESISPSGCFESLAASQVPQMHWASWFDGGTADGALTRFINYTGPMHVIIGAWNHGGTTNADTFGKSQGGKPSPSIDIQHEQILDFLEPMMRPTTPGKPPERLVRYLTMGSNEWRETSIWPPADSRQERYYLASDGLLASAPETEAGEDIYAADPLASTGRFNRWTTQLGAKVDYGNRATADKRLLSYTTARLDYALELTGTPVLHALLRSDRDDGALFAYLEAVAPSGRVTYLTDGALRLLFNDADGSATAYRQLGIMPNFGRDERRPFVPGERIAARFSLNPLSVHIPAGHRIRLSLAGADHGTFEALPRDGDAPTLTFERGGDQCSFIELPVVQAQRGNR